MRVHSNYFVMITLCYVHSILCSVKNGIFLNNLMVGKLLESNSLRQKDIRALPCIRTSRTCLAEQIHRRVWQKQRSLNKLLNKELNITNEKAFINDVLKLMIDDRSDVLLGHNDENIHVSRDLIKLQKQKLRARRKENRKKRKRKKARNQNRLTQRSEIIKLPDFVNTFDLNDFSLLRSFIAKEPSALREEVEKYKGDDVLLTSTNSSDNENMSDIFDMSNSINNSQFIDLANSTDENNDNVTTNILSDFDSDSESSDTKDLLDVVNNSQSFSNLTAFTALLNAMDDISLKQANENNLNNKTGSYTNRSIGLNNSTLNSSEKLTNRTELETNLSTNLNKNTFQKAFALQNAANNTNNVRMYQSSILIENPLNELKSTSNFTQNDNSSISTDQKNVVNLNSTQNMTVVDFTQQNGTSNSSLFKSSKNDITGMKRNWSKENVKKKTKLKHKQSASPAFNTVSKNDKNASVGISGNLSHHHYHQQSSLPTAYEDISLKHNVSRTYRLQLKHLKHKQSFYPDELRDYDSRFTWNDYIGDNPYMSQSAQEDYQGTAGSIAASQADMSSQLNGVHSNQGYGENPVLQGYSPSQSIFPSQDYSISQGYSPPPSNSPPQGYSPPSQSYSSPQDLNFQYHQLGTISPTLSPPSIDVPTRNISWALDIPAGDVKAVRVCKPGPLRPVYPGKPNCLIIGDSISLGYSYSVAAALKNHCQVQLAPASKAGAALDSAYGVKCLNVFLSPSNQQPTSYDVIVFNFGLHDIDYLRLYPEEYNNITRYTKNLHRIKRKLLRTGASLAFPLSTPVSFDKEKDDLLREYNEAANRVMTAKPSITVVDLHQLVTKECGETPFENCYMMKKKHDVHYGVTGSIMLGKKIAYTIIKLLETRKEKTEARLHKRLIDFSENATTCKSTFPGIKCPGGFKCMTNIVSRVDVGCCSLVNGVDCGDSWHCCPKGTVCHPACSDRSCSCIS